MERIERLLNELETKEGITILFAAESGSRAYGTYTAESDYDVRFIYTRNLRDYLSISKKPDTIQYKEENGIELHGWDLLKAMELCHKSNPSLYEWIKSPAVYRKKEGFAERLEALAFSSYSLKRLSLHYHSLAVKNIKILSSKSSTGNKYNKTLLQALRAWLLIRYILDRRELPPVEASLAVDGIRTLKNLEREMWCKVLEAKKKKQSLSPDFCSQCLEHIANDLRDRKEELNELDDQLSKKGEMDRLIWDTLGL